MEFVLLIETRCDEGPRASVGVDEMGKFARELDAQGVLRPRPARSRSAARASASATAPRS